MLKLFNDLFLSKNDIAACPASLHNSAVILLLCRVIPSCSIATNAM